MREFKFRAWDSFNKRWVTKYNVIDEHISPWLGSRSPQYKVVQWTGLQDKNGKDIYEGDIVVLHCGSHPVTATIKWGEHGFIVSIHNKKIKVKGGSMDGKMVSQGKIHTWAGMHSCFSFPHYMEVIGNIYENPELLKGDSP